ncbi:GIY-YIG nuclease family protein [Vibrio harveyi]|nr:GIY-YIG nuclease family protein [Vibrio harveyi]ELC3159997.1 GIY-YIG nuclease family protein [Vibrio harveyi]
MAILERSENAKRCESLLNALLYITMHGIIERISTYFDAAFMLTLNLPTSLSVYVYHIVHEDHKFDLEQGYIGVTKNLERRKPQHFEALKANEHRNYKLQEYYNIHKDKVILYLYKSFPNNKEASAYQLEEFLRPRPNIGLNIAVGGQKTADEVFNAKKYTVSSTHRSPGENLWSGISNYFKTLDKRFASYAEESLKKEEVNQRLQPQKMARLQKELEQKEKERQLKHDKSVLKHLKYLKENSLSEEDQKLVDSWRNRNGV